MYNVMCQYFWPYPISQDYNIPLTFEERVKVRILMNHYMTTNIRMNNAKYSCTQTRNEEIITILTRVHILQTTTWLFILVCTVVDEYIYVLSRDVINN